MCVPLGVVGVDMLDKHLHRECLELGFCDWNGDDYIEYLNNGLHVHFIPLIQFMKRNSMILTH